MAIVPYQNRLKKLASELRKNMTPWEKKLWYEFLREQSPRFLRQKPLGSYIVDFYCPTLRLAIEVDGGQHMSRRAWSVTRSGPRSWDPWESQYFAFPMRTSKKI